MYVYYRFIFHNIYEMLLLIATIPITSCDFPFIVNVHLAD